MTDDAPTIAMPPYSETGQLIDIGNGALFIIANPYRLDGRSSSHPLDIRGWTTMNTFVLIEEDHALVYSTGFSIHREALMAQLRTILKDKTVSLAIPRPEWASMCNARAIADEFNAGTGAPIPVHQRMIYDPLRFLDYDASYERPSPGLMNSDLYMLSATSRTRVHPERDRGLDFIVPELRLLPNNWAYDAATGTLFTGDAFCWVWTDDEAGPWLVDDAAGDPTTPERVAHSLSKGRYWWLRGAATAPIRKSLAEIFDTYPVRIIAPDHGGMIAGAGVARHVGFLDDYLREAEKQPSIGVEAGQWSTASVRNRA